MRPRYQLVFEQQACLERDGAADHDVFWAEPMTLSLRAETDGQARSEAREFLRERPDACADPSCANRGERRLLELKRVLRQEPSARLLESLLLL